MDVLTQQRQMMVEILRDRYHIHSEPVLQAMMEVPRHMFMPKGVQYMAYEDSACPVGYGQTISQPFIVALMLQEVGVQQGDVVLEIGTGTGYSAAVTSRLCQQVYTIENVKQLFENSKANLIEYENVQQAFGDGLSLSLLQNNQKFDRIIVTGHFREPPPHLLAQLKVGGKMIIPISTEYQNVQQLTLIEKDSEHKTVQQKILDVIFVPIREGVFE